MYPDIAMVL